MRTTFAFTCVLLFLVGMEAYAQKPAQKDHPVKELYLSTIDAFNEGNLELFLANFSSDIRMYGTDGNYVGKQALRDRFQVIFKQFPNKRMEIPELEVEVLSKDNVLVNFKWSLYPMGRGPSYRGVGSGVYTLRNGKWIEILEVETVTEVDKELMQK
ncbi:MAG: nuclear transport factor 2 family protein [Bacteroidia bacterium]|nr:nuclear transport factor 2 family protein [Bacteroidia bacterium]